MNSKTIHKRNIFQENAKNIHCRYHHTPKFENQRQLHHRIQQEKKIFIDTRQKITRYRENPLF